MAATSSLPGKAVEASTKEAEAVPVVLRGVLPSRAHPQLGCSAAPFPAAALVVRGSGRRDHILLGVRGITAIALCIIHAVERTLPGYSAHPIRLLSRCFSFMLLRSSYFPSFFPNFFGLPSFSVTPRWFVGRVQIFNCASIAAAFVHVVLLVTLIVRVHKRIGNAGDARDYEALPVKTHTNININVYSFSPFISSMRLKEGRNERTHVALPMAVALSADMRALG